MNQTAAAAANTKAPGVQTRPQRGRRTWLRIFLGGLALWVATVLVTFATQNSNLIPTIILLGSFLVPVTFVTYAFSRADPIITPQRIFSAFIVGGILGVLGASVLEAEFLTSQSALSYLGVGLIEEAVKVAALWLLARRLTRYTVRDGMVLGATVGLGFAAFESAGYAFNALFTHQWVVFVGRCRDGGVARHSDPNRAWGMDCDPRWGVVGCCVTTLAAASNRFSTWLVSGYCTPARAVGRLRRYRGLAHAAAHQHGGAMAHYRGGPRPDGHASPGAYLHNPQLGVAGLDRASRPVDLHPPLAPGDTDRTGGSNCPRD